jgi:hypothetical protein
MKKLLTSLVVAGSLAWAGIAGATCDISSSFTAGQTLTAAQLNTLVTDGEACTNNVLNGDIFSGNMLWYSGVDAIWYNDAGSTVSASILGDTGNVVANGVTPTSISAPCVYFDGGYACNCSMTYGSDTLTITGSAAVLSATNKCVIGMNNASGKPAAFEITADVTTTFNDASNTDENLFGVTTGVAWASAMPMFLHYCDGVAADYFGFSRNPARIETGDAAANMCQEGDEDCDAQGDRFIMSSGLTINGNEEANRPCLTVGSFQATMTSGNDWAVGTLVAGRDGFGLFQGGSFTFPAGQNGNQSAKYLNVADAATTLVFGTQTATYTIQKSGVVTYILNLSNASANGGDGTAVLWFLPFTNAASGAVRAAGAYNGSSAENAHVFILSSGASFSATGPADTPGTLVDNIFSGGAASNFGVTITYPAF